MPLLSALVLREAFESLKNSPVLILVLILNAGMIWSLIYVATLQREERQMLTRMLIEECNGGKATLPDSGRSNPLQGSR